jgi:uncharacterized OB-fold protein
MVRRLSCPRCESAEGFEEVALPSSGEVLALTVAGQRMEELDQVRSRRAACLLALPGGGRLACLLSDADVDLAPSVLRGAFLRVAVRRMSAEADSAAEPITYGIKAVADLRTRLASRAAGKRDASPTSKRGKGDDSDEPHT